MSEWLLVASGREGSMLEVTGPDDVDELAALRAAAEQRRTVRRQIADSVVDHGQGATETVELRLALQAINDQWADLIRQAAAAGHVLADIDRAADVAAPSLYYWLRAGGDSQSTDNSRGQLPRGESRGRNPGPGRGPSETMEATDAPGGPTTWGISPDRRTQMQESLRSPSERGRLVASGEEQRQRGAEAIQELLEREQAVTKEKTRGAGRVVTTFSLDSSKKAQRVAGRKRLLLTRFHSWSQHSSDWGNLPPIPAALERVIQASLQVAAPYGHRLLRPDGGEVTTVLNAPVPGGSLDNATFFTGLDPAGMPTATTLLPIEAKNVRSWTYPQTQELYQVLSKSARLKQANPAVPIVPVLVCREKHPLTAQMANQMGFHVIATWRQYIRPIVTTYDEKAQEKFQEVRDELGFLFELNEGAVDQMVDHFTKHLPRRIETAAARWSTVSAHPDVPDLLHDLRDDDLSGPDRHQDMAELGEAVGDALGEDVSWAGDPDWPG